MAPDGSADGTRSGLHRMVLGLPGGGRGEHRRPLPHASCRLSPCAPYGPFHSATSHSRSRITTALTELPTSSRAVGVDSTSRECSHQPVAAREAAHPSQEGAARGPSGACRAAARRVGEQRGWSSGTCDRSRERRVQLARRKGLTVQVANVLPLAGLPMRRRRAAARASYFR